MLAFRSILLQRGFCVKRKQNVILGAIIITRVILGVIIIARNNASSGIETHVTAVSSLKTLMFPHCSVTPATWTSETFVITNAHTENAKLTMMKLIKYQNMLCTTIATQGISKRLRFNKKKWRERGGTGRYYIFFTPFYVCPSFVLPLCCLVCMRDGLDQYHGRV